MWKKIPPFLLAITAFECARVVFYFINDSEGPNLLVVVTLAAGIDALSLFVYAGKFSGRLKFLVAFLAQLLLAMLAYVCLR
jgi:hypothetical protein